MKIVDVNAFALAIPPASTKTRRIWGAFNQVRGARWPRLGLELDPAVIRTYRIRGESA